MTSRQGRKKRAPSLSAAQRSEKARRAAEARWRTPEYAAIDSGVAFALRALGLDTDAARHLAQLVLGVETTRATQHGSLPTWYQNPVPARQAAVAFLRGRHLRLLLAGFAMPGAQEFTLEPTGA